MNQLPAGWAGVPFADVGVWAGGSTPSKANSEFWTAGTIPWLSPKDMKAAVLTGVQDHVTEVALQRTSLRAMPEGSVAVVVRSGILERTLPVALVPFATTLNQDMKAVEPAEGIDGKWILYAVQSAEQEILRGCRKAGTTVASIEAAALMAWRIPLAPTAEQRRIVAAIEEAFSLLDAGETALHNTRTRLKRMRDAVLTAAVTGQLLPQNPTDTAEVDLAVGPTEGLHMAAGELPDVPESWVIAPLGSVAKLTLGKMLDAKSQTGDHPHEYLRNLNVRWFSFDLSSMAVMDVEPKDLERVTVRAGDLIVCEGGEPGRCAVWRGEPIVIQKALHRVRVTPDVNSHFVALVLRWWSQRPDFSRFITGTTIKHLPKERLRTLPVPVPPLEEQSRIVAEVERQFSFIDAAERAVAEGLRRSAALRRSVLRAAFEGRLVPQDPADEPASVLLERIAAERAAAAPKKRAPRRVRGKAEVS